MSEPAFNISSINWSDIPKYRFTFHTIIDSGFSDLKYIHPLKQKAVNQLFIEFSGCEYISRLYIFGSATDMRCHIKSDIDVAVELDGDYNTRDMRNQISETIQNICEWNADVLWLNDIKENENIYKNILGGIRLI